MIIKTTEEIIKIIESCKTTDSEKIESDEIEFKEYSNLNSLHGSKDLAEEISALANKNGGLIVVGVRDGNNVKNCEWSSQLPGFELGDTIEIEQRLKGKLKPSIDLKAEYVEVDNKHFLALHVPSRRDTLIATSSGKVCIRDGRSSRPMSPDEIRAAVSRLQNYDWTAELIDNLSIDDLDNDSVSAALKDYCLRKKYENENLPNINAFLEAIGATSNGKITKAGLLFLGKSAVIKNYLGTYEYRFSWKTRAGQLKINDVWDENLWKSILRSKSHFNNCNAEHNLEFKDKIYTCKMLDENAFHEGFMNALVHRDYSIEGMVVVDFDSAQMTIVNPGVFYGGVSADNIGIHQPRHRNKALAKLMMNFQLVDRAGMGVRRMGIGSLMYGRHFPTFREAFDTVEVVLSAGLILPGIFVLTRENPEKFGIIDLIIFNSIYKSGVISLKDLSKRTKGIVNKLWAEVRTAVARHPQIELCGSKDGIYIRVAPKWNSVFEVRKTFKIPTTSEKHISVYDYLFEFSEASNEDITNLLKHKNATHTSKFLKEASYAKREGNGPSARWSLIEML